jgi:hypothetical protein
MPTEACTYVHKEIDNVLAKVLVKTVGDTNQLLKQDASGSLQHSIFLYPKLSTGCYSAPIDEKSGQNNSQLKSLLIRNAFGEMNTGLTRCNSIDLANPKSAIFSTAVLSLVDRRRFCTSSDFPN